MLMHSQHWAGTVYQTYRGIVAFAGDEERALFTLFNNVEPVAIMRLTVYGVAGTTIDTMLVRLCMAQEYIYLHAHVFQGLSPLYCMESFVGSHHLADDHDHCRHGRQRDAHCLGSDYRRGSGFICIEDLHHHGVQPARRYQYSMYRYVFVLRVT
jgi:hypothetical protein